MSGFPRLAMDRECHALSGLTDRGSVSVEQRVELVLLYGECNRNAEATARKFNSINAGVKPISSRYVRWLLQKFQKTGIVSDAKRTGKPAVCTDDISAFSVIQETEENPGSSTRRIAQCCGISRSSVSRILKREKFKRFVEHQLHQLHVEDLERRYDFCRLFLDRIDVSSVLFTDEAVFTMFGRVSKAYFWARSNPHRYRAARSQKKPKLMVWAGIVGRQLIGPYFFSRNVTGEKHFIYV